MVLRYIERLLVHTPLLVASGGAAMVLAHIPSTHFPIIECLESFILIWLAYRFFQTDCSQNLHFERILLLTILFLIFFLLGTPISLIFAGFLCWGYRGMRSFTLRKIPFIKNLTIALAWVCSTTGLIQPTGADTCLFFLQDFFLIFGLSLLSDLRDIQIDLPHLRTAAHVLQPKWTWVVSWLAVAIYLLPLENLPYTTLGLILSTFLGMICYWLLLLYVRHRQLYTIQTICIDGAIGICAILKFIQ
jgi:hypothetical protein